ncbi:MAG: 3'-5' exonuclease, partial [Anderseniella sp.]
MTVHGAKGLEAPIVFLPDTCTVPKNRSAKIVYTSEGVPVWTLKKKYSNPQVSNLQSDARELALEEYNRLLYVAMTRARYRLYVCGFMKKAEAEAPKDSWYAKILTALAGSDPKFLDEVVVDGLKRWCGGERTVPQTDRRSGDVAVTPATPPAWTGAQARPVQQPVRWLAPSRLLAAGETDTGWSREVALSPLKPRVDSRFRRGQLVHRLLQTLPEMPMDQRDDAARRYLKVNGVPSEEAEATINEIKALFHDASFADVFSAASRAEVSIAAFLPRNDGQGFGLSGQIDRLLVLPDRVVVVDFKTNRPPPDDVAQVPEIYLRQLAAYSHALQRVYPGRKVECALLWTDVPRLMPIPQFMLDQAWASATITMA